MNALVFHPAYSFENFHAAGGPIKHQASTAGQAPKDGQNLIEFGILSRRQSVQLASTRQGGEWNGRGV